MELVYKNEKTMFALLLAISLVIWTGLIVGTLGLALVYLLFFFLFYCFAQSALISYLKGTGVKITAQQFPDLKARISECCRKLDVQEEPEAYLLHMGGSFNAFATRFLGREFIVLYADIVDAFDDNPDALNFYIGHEIGHLKRKHLRWAPVLFPAAFLPLIGAAYSRAREYTCDRHGLAVCEHPTNAQLGLAALAAGGKRWRTMSKTQYVAQARESKGFWMSFHELVSDYPWLVKRMAALKALASGQEVRQPSRNPFAYLLALFVPRLGVGSAGSVMVVVAIIGILAAVAIPAYQQYQTRAEVASALHAGKAATAAVERYIHDHDRLPGSLEEAGYVPPAASPAVDDIALDGGSGIIRITLATATLAGKAILLAPYSGENKQIGWRCGSEDIPANLLPPECRNR
jgi:Zn-dependent protease with chaperone function/competence protein ComGC